MKSMNGKRKSLQSDHILDNKQSKQFKLPLGYRGACHLHKEIVLFKTIDDIIKHNHEKHDCRRINIL